jgi:hypothetical protein
VPAPDGYHAAVAVAGAADVEVTLHRWPPIDAADRTTDYGLRHSTGQNSGSE